VYLVTIKSKVGVSAQPKGKKTRFTPIKKDMTLYFKSEGKEEEGNLTP